MTQREQFAAWIVRYPGVCDDCAADALGFPSRQRANQLGRELESAGRLHRVDDACVRCSRTKTVSVPRRSGKVGPPVARPSPAARAVILDGAAALAAVVTRAGFRSVVDAVTAHTVFLHPDTVAVTQGQPVLPMIRAPLRTERGRVVELPDGRRAWADDNGPPTDVFLWAAKRRKGRDVQFNHVWPTSDTVEGYTALWNLCATPAFLAKTTDTDEAVQAALRYRAWELYGCQPPNTPAVARPDGYDTLKWAPFASQ